MDLSLGKTGRAVALALVTVLLAVASAAGSRDAMAAPAPAPDCSSDAAPFRGIAALLGQSGPNALSAHFRFDCALSVRADGTRVLIGRMTPRAGGETAVRAVWTLRTDGFIHQQLQRRDAAGGWKSFFVGKMRAPVS